VGILFMGKGIKNLEGEIWKDVLGREGEYQVSNFGRVKSLERRSAHKKIHNRIIKEKILKPYLGIYYSVYFAKKEGVSKGKLVHRLIAIAFIPNPKNKYAVNHINGVKTDNRIENLEWCTKGENERHAYKVCGKINALRKLTPDDVQYIRKHHIKGVGSRKGTTPILALKFNVCSKTIRNVTNGKNYSTIK
jgi:hypothetical protein